MKKYLKDNKRQLKNILPVLSANTIKILFALIIPREFIKLYGPEMHGFLAVIMNLVQYIMLVEAGVSTTFVQLLVSSENNEHEFYQTIRSVYNYFKLLGRKFILGIIVIGLLYSLLNDLPLDTVQSFVMFSIVGFSFFLNISFFSFYRSVFQYYEEHVAVNWILTVAALIKGLLQIILLNLGSSVLMVLFVLTIESFSKLILSSLVLKKKYPTIAKLISDSITTKTEDTSDLTARSRHQIMHQLCSLVVNSTDSISLSIFVSYSVVSVYNVYSLMIATIVTILTQLTYYPYSVKLGKVLIQNGSIAFRKEYIIYQRFFYGIVTIVLITFHIMLIPFIKLYTKGIASLNYIDEKVAILITLIGLLTLMRNPQLISIFVFNLYRETKSHAVIEASINLIVSLLLIFKFGVYGVLIGTIISFLYRNYMLVSVEKRVLIANSIFNTNQFFYQSRTFIIIFITVTLKWRYQLVLEVSNWIMWLITSITVFVTSTLIMLIIDYLSLKILKEDC